jgi:hypothetical protein
LTVVSPSSDEAQDYDPSMATWPDVDALPDEFFASIDTTRERLRATLEFQRAYDAGAPQVGDIAPDFTLSTLNADGSLGDPITLSELRGQPVALLFGSYT